MTVVRPALARLSRELNAILSIIGDASPTARPIEGLPEGYLQINHFNPKNVLRTDGPSRFFPFFVSQLDEAREVDWARHDSEVEIGLDGVCDSPVQVYERYHDRLDEIETNVCVVFTHIPKEPERAGMGGGWRWHKWGEYIGDGQPQCEYLDDEPGFDDGVWVYSIVPYVVPDES
jgi:hypothetical protein